MSKHDIPALDSVHNGEEKMGMDMMQRGESEDEKESESGSY
jgi:hypothetical protein